MNMLLHRLHTHVVLYGFVLLALCAIVAQFSHVTHAQMQLRDPGFDGNADGLQQAPTRNDPVSRQDPVSQNDPVNNPNDIVINFPNPLNAPSLQCLIYDIFTIAINVFAIIAALFIIWSGFKFVAAQGNPEKLKEARRTFIYVLIGTAIILGAWVITQFIVNTVNELMGEDIVQLSERACEPDTRR